LLFSLKKTFDTLNPQYALLLSDLPLGPFEKWMLTIKLLRENQVEIIKLINDDYFEEIFDKEINSTWQDLPAMTY